MKPFQVQYLAFDGMQVLRWPCFAATYVEAIEMFNSETGNLYEVMGVIYGQLEEVV